MRIFSLVVLLLIAEHSYAQCPASRAVLLAGGTFSGNCTINLGGATTISNNVTFTSGTLRLNGGNLTVSNANFTNASGASVLINNGSLTITNGANFVSAGTVSVNNGIFVTGNATRADFQMGSATTLNGNFNIIDSEVIVAGTFTDRVIDQNEILLEGTSVLTVNEGANISGFDDLEFRNNDGVSRVIINGGTLSIEDALDLRGSSTDGDFVEVNGGVLDVGGNIALNNVANSNLLIINPGGSVQAATIGGVAPTDPSALPQGVQLNGGSFDVGGNALPVELVDFVSNYDEESRSVTLQWSTATEINNKGFYIERSPIGSSSFTERGFVAGSGDSKELVEYKFTDSNILSSYYYRLKQMDHDGAFEYSPLVLVKTANVETFDFELNLYPNPSRNSRINIEGISNVEFSATLYDLGGVVLFNEPVANASSVELLINTALTNAKPGIYFFAYGDQASKKTISIVRE